MGGGETPRLDFQTPLPDQCECSRKSSRRSAGALPASRPSVGRGGRAAPEKLDSPVVVLRVPVTGAWVRPGMDQGIG